MGLGICRCGLLGGVEYLCVVEDIGLGSECGGLGWRGLFCFCLGCLVILCVLLGIWGFVGLFLSGRVFVFLFFGGGCVLVAVAGSVVCWFL